MAPTDSVPVITAALTRETDGNVRGQLAKTLVDVATRMEPAGASRVLSQALARETDAYARSSLASALSEVAGRMDPTEAARICGQAARTLADALGRETDANARNSLARLSRQWRAGWSRPRRLKFAAGRHTCWPRPWSRSRMPMPATHLRPGPRRQRRAEWS